MSLFVEIRLIGQNLMMSVTLYTRAIKAFVVVLRLRI